MLNLLYFLWTHHKDIIKNRVFLWIFFFFNLSNIFFTDGIYPIYIFRFWHKFLVLHDFFPTIRVNDMSINNNIFKKNGTLKGKRTERSETQAFP